MDLIVNLYQEKLQTANVFIKNENIKIKRILSPNADHLVDFVLKTFNDTWASEVKAGAYSSNPSCYIATDNGKIVGFACFDATAKGFFGPTGINPEYRGLNIGQALLIATLRAMKEAGYGYAAIGGTTEALSNFYGKYIDLFKIDSKDSIYSRLTYR